MVELASVWRKHGIWSHAVEIWEFVHVLLLVVDEGLNLLLHVALTSVYLLIKNMGGVLHELFVLCVGRRMLLLEVVTILYILIWWLEWCVGRLGWHWVATSAYVQVSVWCVTSHSVILLVTGAKLLLSLVKLIIWLIVAHDFVWDHLSLGLNN